MRYVTMVGDIISEPFESKHDRLCFKLRDPNGLDITCYAPFQLAHHVREGDYIMCYGKIVTTDDGRMIVSLEAIHEEDRPVPEPNTFELGGAL